jgi:peptidoglycan/xylan/chitin deacetylase (PgdA/CDA1 family)
MDFRETKMSTAHLVISLDFEMYWGLRSGKLDQSKINCLEQVPYVVDELLVLFRKYNIATTWATVGLLGCDNLEEARSLIPKVTPKYTDQNLCPYFDLKSTAIELLPESILFAPQLISKIKATPKQEVASHTFSHFYCLADGATSESFRDDVLLMKYIGDKLGLDLKSFVFPRNQIDQECIKVLSEFGYSGFRAGGSSWINRGVKKKSHILRLARGLDYAIGLTKSDIYSEDDISYSPLVEVRASRFLWYNGKKINSTYQKLCYENILREINFAVKNKKTYHLWWHPHNFGSSPSNALQYLTNILEYCRPLIESEQLKSVTLGELASNRVDG